ncbi:DUF3168 domain-containing protein [Poseidonocella sp. HB161398]|uniref:DUF3168 domain-containing protein n=1 Tax=Poseidonocella sp. HB161398 TaxID=2320855 RepID=UPI001109D3B5|nr:DUF3168 domain-containing protein [Poseidonocella sp. HB161398]
MSYGVSKALQGAVFAALSGDAALAAVVGTNVFDAPPAGAVPELHVALGAEDAFARPDSSGSVTTHRLIVSVIGPAEGFARAKEAAVAVSDALDGAALALARGRLLSLGFRRARARRTDGNSGRRIDLTFRAIVEDS